MFLSFLRGFVLVFAVCLFVMVRLCLCVLLFDFMCACCVCLFASWNLFLCVVGWCVLDFPCVFKFELCLVLVGVLFVLNLVFVRIILWVLSVFRFYVCLYSCR